MAVIDHTIIDDIPGSDKDGAILVWNQSKKEYESNLTVPVFMTQEEYSSLTPEQQASMWVIIKS